MPKRKREENFKHLLGKIRKLERKVNRRRIISSSSEEEDFMLTSPQHSSEKECNKSVEAALGPQDWLTPCDETTENDGSIPIEISPEIVTNQFTESNESITSLAAVPIVQEESAANSLDSDVLEILGEDPSAVKRYAPEVHTEIARRFQHIATNGLSKETRKELLTKYLTPENCAHVGAPGLNPEIKAALPEAFVKRDKGIETKQSQLASAISCLAEILSCQLNSKTKNNEMLSKMMDMGRLLCDIQHGDSITRRNFIFFNLKKEMKEHLSNTNIDTWLFGESLPETLKSAKAVSKSGTELKPMQKKAPKAAVPKTLNRRAPAPARRPPGPPPRSHEPAGPPSRAPPRPPPLPRSSKTSLHQPPSSTRNYHR